MSFKSRFYSLFSVAALGACCVLSVAGQPMAPQNLPPSARHSGPAPPAESGDGGDSADCADGVVLDDGSAESGYGWVPSVIEGEYVQEFDADRFTSRRLRSVCICWLRTQPDTELDFEIVFYRQVVDPEEGERLVPAAEPYAVFPASAEVVPSGVTESFFEVDVRGVMMPSGRSYIGARWNPSQDRFFFICVDTSEDTVPVEAFFRDDRAEGEWASVLESTDPIFQDHRALMIRVLPGPELVVDVPALGPSGLATLAAALAALALVLVARSRR